MSSGITVGIPVGPRPGHRAWLGEAIISCQRQTLLPDEIVLVVDETSEGLPEFTDTPPCRVWVAPWKLGAANGFNHAVGLARTPYVFLLASDDTLDPYCLELCKEEIGRANDPNSALVWVGVRYMDSGETQELPCGAMMVAKALWERIGGYPLECIFGAPDHVLFSCLLHKGREYGIDIRGVSRPLYNYRTHEDTEAFHRGQWHWIMGQVRDTLTQLWEPRW